MFVELPQELILLTTSAFVLGWVLSMINSRLNAKRRSLKRDPRDDLIRELEAAARVAKCDAERKTKKLDEANEKIRDMEDGVLRRDNVISDQQEQLAKTTTDLRESVAKTRELRAELTERATENVKSEAKLREVETELSVAQASTDMIATGVLDYALVDEDGDADNAEDSPDLVDPVDLQSSAS